MHFKNRSPKEGHCKMLSQLLCIVLCFAWLSAAVGQSTERPKTDNDCVIHLIGSSFPKSVESVGGFERVSFKCTGSKLPVAIRVHPDVLNAASEQEGVKLKADTEVRGLVQFEDVRSLTILDSVFEKLTGSGLAPVVFDRSAGLFYNCRFANNNFDSTGGIYSAGGSLMHVYDSVFEKNIGGKYGAVWVTNGCRTLFRNTHFRGNHGGLRNRDVDGFAAGAVFSFQNTLTEFEGCQITNNVAYGAGGGVYTGLKRSVVEFRQCTIKKNTGGAGAISLTSISTCVMKDTHFVQNHGSPKSGPIFLNLKSEITIDGCRMSGNTGVSGVILAQDSSKVEIKSSWFKNNRGSAHGGVVSLMIGGELDIQESEFTANSGAFGGAVYQEDGLKSVLKASVFTENVAQLSGGALFQKDVKSTYVSDCAFTNNEGGAVGGGVSTVGCGAADWLTSDSQSVVKCKEFTAPRCELVSIVGCSFDGNVASIRGSSIFQDRCKTVIVTSTSFPDEDVTLVQKHCEKREFVDNTETTLESAVSVFECPKKLQSDRKLLSTF